MRPVTSAAVAMGSTWRPPAGGSLVLLNSIGSDDHAWRWLGIADAVPVTYPGHGGRPRWPGWRHEDIADEVAATVDGPLDLLGVALGGLIALQVLVRHPGRVRSAIIASGGSARSAAEPGAAKPGTTDRLAAVRKAAADRGERALRAGMAAVADETIERWFTPFAIRTRHPGAEYARKTLTAMAPEAWNDAWLSLASASLISAQDAAAIGVPVTLVAGMHDRSSGLAGLFGLHRLIPRSRLEILPAPHMIHLEQPENLRTSIERHFAWMRTGNRVERPISSPGWPDRGVTDGQQP
jgi:3-oxoadipate enol-lactonase